MNTLGTLKAQARLKGKYKAEDKFTHLEHTFTFSGNELDEIIEHTHTQTIQSVRERVSALEKRNHNCGCSAERHRSGCDGDIYMEGYNEAIEALTDLLKDLEAPVEGVGKISKEEFELVMRKEVE